MALLALFASTLAVAQDLTPGLIYTCSGERMFIENCNVRDTSDNATCMVGHPDHILPNGLMQYTNMTRGALKKLFPTCKQPTAQEIAKAQAFQKKQQDIYDANVAKANNQMAARPQPVAGGGNSQQQIAPPKNAEERAMRRCVSSGRLPASCTGNQLLGAFGQMINSVASQVAPGLIKDGPASGPTMAGVFVGPGNWRLDFIDGGVLVNCSFLSPNQEAYSLDFKGGRAVITIGTRPKPLVLTLSANETTITGPPGPVTIDGVVAAGYTPGSSSPGHTETSQTTTHETVDKSQTGMYGQSQLTYQGNGQYDAATTHTNSTYVPGASTPGYTNFVPKRATCSAINLSTKGASVGVQTMQTDLLKTMFGGDKGPPTPPGIRMHGIYAASTGFSVEFFPESAILGCGPDSARAYPYTVEADGTKAVVKINAPDHPLTLAFAANGSLEPAATGPYQVPRTHRHRPERRRRLHLRSHGADLQPRRSRSQQDHSLQRRHRCNHGRVRSCARVRRSNSDSRHGRIQRRRHTLGSRCHPGRRHSRHHLRVPSATWRSQSSRRPSLRSPPRQLRQRARKGWSHRPTRSLALQIRWLRLRSHQNTRLPKDLGRHQSQRRLGRPCRRQRQRHLSRRRPRHLLFDDLRARRQSGSSYGTSPCSSSLA